MIIDYMSGPAYIENIAGTQKDLIKFLDAVTMPVALINELGIIIYHNRPWREAGGSFLCGELSAGDNYFEMLEKKYTAGFLPALNILERIIKFMASNERETQCEYDYFQKIYRLKITAYQSDGNKIVLMNEDITSQRENEIALLDLKKRLKIMNAIYEMAGRPVNEILKYALENTLEFISAEFGFTGFLNEDESEMSIHSWSEKAMADCALEQKPRVYSIGAAGCWAEAVRQRKVIAVDEYSENITYNHGIPAGHVPIDNFISVPIFDGNKIKMLIVLANKLQGFNDNDVKTICIIFNGIWNIVKLKKQSELLNEAYEKLKSIDDMKTNFISMVSHELRTPLTSIIGFNKLIMKKFGKLFAPLADENNLKLVKARDEINENINIILSEGERLKNLINNVLDIQKLESGKSVFDMRCNSIKELINKSYGAVIPLLNNKNVDFIIEVDEWLPDIICDREKITQVLINLFSNAIKFTFNGYIKCKAEKFNENEIIISVIDTGIGMSGEDLRLIFDKFKQAGDTLKRGDNEKGSGLGLAICRDIVERHNGKIWVNSVYGGGSMFHFTLSVNYKDNKSISDNAKLITDSLKENVFNMLGKSQGEFIIIDSSEKILNLLEIAVQSGGYKTRMYKNSVEALLNMKSGFKKPGALIITEEIMRDESIDIVKIIKNDPDIYDIPVFIVKLKLAVIDMRSFILIDKFYVW